MADRYPRKGSYASFLILVGLLFVLIMVGLWFWLRRREPVPVHTTEPQSSELERMAPASYPALKTRDSGAVPA